MYILNKLKNKNFDENIINPENLILEIESKAKNLTDKWKDNIDDKKSLKRKRSNKRLFNALNLNLLILFKKMKTLLKISLK